MTCRWRTLAAFRSDKLHGCAMSFDPTWLFLSLFPSGIGFVLFVYGRKRHRWPHIVAGLLFMTYPYVTTTVWSLVAVGVLLGFALWVAVRLDW
jgi:hypothetical protein